jgi:hypothetical protein
MLYWVHLARAGFKSITSVVICTDCIGSCKSNYHKSRQLWSLYLKWSWNKWYYRHSVYFSLDLLLAIYNQGILKTTCTLHNKGDDFTFPIVNFPFISSNIPAGTSVWILHFATRIIRGFVPSIVIFCTKLSCWHRSYSNKTMLLLGWSFAIQFYGRHHEKVDHCQISIPQVTMELSPFWVELCPPSPTRHLPDLAE